MSEPKTATEAAIRGPRLHDCYDYELVQELVVRKMLGGNKHIVFRDQHIFVMTNEELEDWKRGQR